MSRTAARAGARKPQGPTAAGLAVAAVVLGVLVHQSAASPAPASSAVAHGDHGGAVVHADGALTEADGVVPEGVTVFEDRYPGVADLAPALRQALRDAAGDAADDGIELYVNSGWRSAEYQDQLLQEAVSKYGSDEEAARWVAAADTSAHVSGNAVDIGHASATEWLSRHGAAYGLCRIYRNEPWHFELRPAAGGHGCPPTYADPTADPRMQQ